MILVTGATGFVGRNLVRGLCAEGVSVRALVREPEKAAWLKDLSVELAIGDVTDKASLEKAAWGMERVVHLVGIIQEAPGATFQGVHVDCTRNVLEASKKASVRHFFYMSSLGTRPNAKSDYHKTKWQAEELVRASAIPFTILRPSLIYGKGDGFTTRLAQAIRLSPFLPIIGAGRSKVQPIFIQDVVSCIVKAVTSNRCADMTCEIGGPEQLTYEEVTIALAEAMGIRRPLLHMPLVFMSMMARILETILTTPPLTTNQLTMLQEDNICSLRDIRDVFGIEPMQFRKGLATFL
jgi:uncharacterized protein YbjT (DUF2867 family)